MSYDAITTSAPSYEGVPARGACGCSGCRGNQQLESELAPARKGCAADVPAEVDSCEGMTAVRAVQCDPQTPLACPVLPETWRSNTVAGVPFFYAPRITRVGSAGAKRSQITANGTPAKLQIVPGAWRAAHRWVTAMNTTFGMPISAVYTASRGRYCRCVRQPSGVCKESKPEDWNKCTGKALSNHGHGDAIDIIGVRWADAKAVGSSLATTVMHSWQDPEQGALLLRIGAALRCQFHTVLDYSRSDHRDHFHVDMNRGRVRALFEEQPCEPNFILTALRRLGYVSSAAPVTWARARDALGELAGVISVAPPANRDDKAAWRPVAQRLFACVALGVAGQCAKR